MDGFSDRRDAGRRLGRLLAASDLGDDLVVLGLPRGGRAVAAEVALALDAPLDVVIVRRLDLPGAPESAMGALAEEDVRDVDWDLVERLGLSIRDFSAVERLERDRLDERIADYRVDHPSTDLTGRTALIVDDILSTGATARAAVETVRRRGAARIIVAVPVGALDADRLVPGADAVYCLRRPEPLGAVGDYYRDDRPDAQDDPDLDRAATEERRAQPVTGSPVGRESRAWSGSRHRDQAMPIAATPRMNTAIATM
jgi:putative phosphoribosyl transferase